MRRFSRRRRFHSRSRRRRSRKFSMRGGIRFV